MLVTEEDVIVTTKPGWYLTGTTHHSVVIVMKEQVRFVRGAASGC